MTKVQKQCGFDGRGKDSTLYLSLCFKEDLFPWMPSSAELKDSQEFAHHLVTLSFCLNLFKSLLENTEGITCFGGASLSPVILQLIRTRVKEYGFLLHSTRV